MGTSIQDFAAQYGYALTQYQTADDLKMAVLAQHQNQMNDDRYIALATADTTRPEDVIAAVKSLERDRQRYITALAPRPSALSKVSQLRREVMLAAHSVGLSESPNLTSILEGVKRREDRFKTLRIQYAESWTKIKQEYYKIHGRTIKGEIDLAKEDIECASSSGEFRSAVSQLYESLDNCYERLEEICKKFDVPQQITDSHLPVAMNEMSGRR